jgi:hypothetical protein
VESGFRWVDHETEHLMEKQGEDGVIAGWHGDGNYARTVLMYALWKTQGCRVQPWRGDVSVGAVTSGNELLITVRSRWPWKGKLLFDQPRHRKYFGLPFDYPRLNQYPEWFTVDSEQSFELTSEGAVETVLGQELLDGISINLEGGFNLVSRIKVKSVRE